MRVAPPFDASLMPYCVIPEVGMVSPDFCSICSPTLVELDVQSQLISCPSNAQVLEH